jgi:hypothetical protein
LARYLVSRQTALGNVNVTLDTTLQAYRDAIWNAAFDATFATNNELLVQELEMEVLSRDAKTGVVTTRFSDPPPRAEFGGLTSTQWQKAQEERLADSGQIQVFEKWTLHSDYSCGIGLHATIHEPYLTKTRLIGLSNGFWKTRPNTRASNRSSFLLSSAGLLNGAGKIVMRLSTPWSGKLLSKATCLKSMIFEYDFSNAIKNPYAALLKPES